MRAKVISRNDKVQKRNRALFASHRTMLRIKFLVVLLVMGCSYHTQAQRYTLKAHPDKKITYPGRIKSAWPGPATTIAVDIDAGKIDITGSPKRSLRITSRDSTYRSALYKYSYYFRCVDQSNHSCSVTVDLPSEYFTQKGVVSLGYSNRFYIYSVTDQGK